MGSPWDSAVMLDVVGAVVTFVIVAVIVSVTVTVIALLMTQYALPPAGIWISEYTTLT